MTIRRRHCILLHDADPGVPRGKCLFRRPLSLLTRRSSALSFFWAPFFSQLLSFEPSEGCFIAASFAFACSSDLTFLPRPSLSAMNFTLDDTASQLSYSGWAAQSSADSNASQFFGGTYHVAQVNGATLNMSVAGSALYIFGSMGPRHVSIRTSVYRCSR